MDFYVQTLLLSATIVSFTAVANSRVISVFGVVNGKIHMECNLPVAEDPDVEWVDLVWTSDDKPKRIYESKNNPSFEILSSHENKENFRVNSKYTLTISNLDMDSDVGQYTCRSRVGDAVHTKHYYLTIGELPDCTGEVNLHTGNNASLSCEMAYSGHNPTLEWHENDQMMKSMDEYDIRLAKKVANVHATHRQDGAKFRCQMTLGEVTHSCHLTLNVTYAVHEPRFHPEKEKFKAGELVRCSAKGNPTPKMTLTPNLPTAVNGNGWVEFTIDPSWEGKQMSVQCTASNQLDGNEHVKSTPLSFHVSMPHKRTTQHQHHHSTTAAAVVIPKEKEHKEHHHLEPADQHSEHNKKESATNHKDVKPPNPDVKPVKADNSSAGTLIQSLFAMVLCLLITSSIQM